MQPFAHPPEMELKQVYYLILAIDFLSNPKILYLRPLKE